MAVVIFDQGAFAARYPEFVAIPSTTLQLYFNEATIYLNNTDSSPVTDGSPGGMRAMLLNMLTAHIAALNSGVNGNAAPNTVGRVDSATQGSVSAHIEFQVPGTAAWFAQTKYGAAYWQATASYRSMHYISGSSKVQRWPR